MKLAFGCLWIPGAGAEVLCRVLFTHAFERMTWIVAIHSEIVEM